MTQAESCFDLSFNVHFKPVYCNECVKKISLLVFLIIMYRFEINECWIWYFYCTVYKAVAVPAPVVKYSLKSIEEQEILNLTFVWITSIITTGFNRKRI